MKKKLKSLTPGLELITLTRKAEKCNSGRVRARKSQFNI